jgi:hypothetical protein
MYIPFMQYVLSIQPVLFNVWLGLTVVALGLILVMEADKWLMLRRKK